MHAILQVLVYFYSFALFFEALQKLSFEVLQHVFDNSQFVSLGYHLATLKRISKENTPLINV